MSSCSRPVDRASLTEDRETETGTGTGTDEIRGEDTDIMATEVFSAIQGEAALVGERQVFVRLSGCNIRCCYCDQPEALDRRPGPCRIERTPGKRDWEVVASPLPTSELVAAVDDLCRQLPHHSISLTGGEPLMQSERTTRLAQELARRGLHIMLETNATLVPALCRVLPWTRYVSMDLKLPSVDGGRVAPALQRRFLDTALASGTTTWVKIVLGPSTDVHELDGAVALVADAVEVAGRRVQQDPPTEIFLQPVTPFADVIAAPTPDQVLVWHERALRRYPRVRVVPQTHKAIGQL